MSGDMQRMYAAVADARAASIGSSSSNQGDVAPSPAGTVDAMD
jgi:hypothetical protein